MFSLEAGLTPLPEKSLFAILDQVGREQEIREEIDKFLTRLDSIHKLFGHAMISLALKDGASYVSHHENEQQAAISVAGFASRGRIGDVRPGRPKYQGLRPYEVGERLRRFIKEYQESPEWSWDLEKRRRVIDGETLEAVGAFDKPLVAAALLMELQSDRHEVALGQMPTGTGRIHRDDNEALSEFSRVVQDGRLYRRHYSWFMDNLDAGSRHENALDQGAASWYDRSNDRRHGGRFLVRHEGLRDSELFTGFGLVLENAVTPEELFRARHDFGLIGSGQPELCDALGARMAKSGLEALKDPVLAKASWRERSKIARAIDGRLEALDAMVSLTTPSKLVTKEPEGLTP